MSTPQLPSIGRIVHFVLNNGEHRAAIVVNYFGGDRANLTVFMDQLNDFEVTLEPDTGHFKKRYIKNNLQPTGALDYSDGTSAVGSAKQDEDGKAPGTWHFPERQ